MTDIQAYEYYLRHWGEVNNPDQKWLERDLGITEEDHWFDTAEERAAFRAKLQACADSHECRIVFAEYEGRGVRLRTVARMTMRLQDGRSFGYEHDFGYAYDPARAHNIWHAGSYGCDCGRSQLLNCAGHDVDEIECGKSIYLENFRVTQEPFIRHTQELIPSLNIGIFLHHLQDESSDEQSEERP